MTWLLSALRRHLVCVKVAIWHHANVVYSGLLMLLVRNLEKVAVFSFSGQWRESTVQGLTVSQKIHEVRGVKFARWSSYRDVGSL